MKISVDGGALNPKNDQRFGTSVFSENLIASLKQYDKKNQYKIYTFENLKPKLFWMKGRVSLEEIREKKDVFLALNQALPVYVAGKIISFCHGLSYYFYPQYYSRADVVRLKRQREEMIQRSDFIIVSSKKVREELTSLYRYIEEKIIVLPFGIPLDMEKSTPTDASTDKKKYFLFVANNQPIKNVEFVIDSFIKSKLNKQGYRLFLVGNWKEFQNNKEGIDSTSKISREEIKKLYQQATALLTSSFYESFNFPVLEALSQGCHVIGLKSAIIPELKPFVKIASTKKQFISSMNQSINNKSVNDTKTIQKQFSWKNYVKDLVKLY